MRAHQSGRALADIRDRHVILALACLAQFVVLLVVYSVGALAPLLRDALHLSREQIGSLTTLFFLGAIPASIPVGWLADRLGVRGFLIAAQVVSGLAVAAMPWLHTYLALLVVMFLAGVGHGTVMVLTNKTLYDWFPRERLATAMGAKFVAISCPGIVAGTAMPTLALWVGWRQAFALVGGLTLTSALSALLLYRDPPHEGPSPAPLPVSDGRRGRWLDRGFWCLVTAGFLFAGAQSSFITYLALFVHDTWGVPVALAAGPLALAHVGAAASRVPYGWVSDRWLKGARTPLLRGMGVLAMAALLTLLLLPQGTSALVLSTVTLLFGISGLSWGGLYYTLAAERAGRAAAGIGLGIASTCYQIGSTVTPLLFGYLADVTGAYTASWGLLVLGLLLGVGLLGWVQAASPMAEERAELGLVPGTR
jgi:predicted MFS family arabinose efflux permease